MHLHVLQKVVHVHVFDGAVNFPLAHLTYVPVLCGFLFIYFLKFFISIFFNKIYVMKDKGSMSIADS